MNSMPPLRVTEPFFFLFSSSYHLPNHLDNGPGRAPTLLRTPVGICGSRGRIAPWLLISRHYLPIGSRPLMRLVRPLPQYDRVKCSLSHHQNASSVQLASLAPRTRLPQRRSASNMPVLSLPPKCNPQSCDTGRACCAAGHRARGGSRSVSIPR